MVEYYPFHSVMMQHRQFGNGIRNLLAKKYKTAVKHEMNEEWKENLLTIADYYLEVNEIESD